MKAERMRAEQLSAAIDQLLRDPQAQPDQVEPDEAGLLSTARLVASLVERLGPADPALEQRTARSREQPGATRPAGRRPRLRVAWYGLVALLLLVTLLTPVGQTALASFMAVFRLGRTEVSITPADLTLTATAVAESTAVRQELTLEQAQAQVHFAIPEPGYLPSGYRLRGAISYTYPDLPAWVPQPFAIELIYENGQGQQISLRLYPILLGDKASISRLNLEAAPIQDVRDVDVSGKPGVLLRLGAEGAEAAWQEVVWEQGDLILAMSTASLTEEELLDMARSVR
jgi:hypothetical protein